MRCVPRGGALRRGPQRLACRARLPPSAAQAYAEESLGIIKKQKDIIDRMQQENAVRRACQRPWLPRASARCRPLPLGPRPPCWRSSPLPRAQGLKAELDMEMRFAQKKEAKDTSLTALHNQSASGRRAERLPSIASAARLHPPISPGPPSRAQSTRTQPRWK